MDDKELLRVSNTIARKYLESNYSLLDKQFTCLTPRIQLTLRELIKDIISQACVDVSSISQFPFQKRPPTLPNYDL